MGVVVVCAMSAIYMLLNNFAYADALNSNLIYDDGWVNAPVKYIPSYEELSLEDKQLVQQFEQSERVKADSKYEPVITIEEKIVYRLMTEYKKDSVEAKWWADQIMRASTNYKDVSPREIMTLLEVESTFSKNPKGNRNVGPMQVNKGVWLGKTKYNLYKPDQNIQLGTEIFQEYKRGCKGKLECAFKTYNVGPGDYKRKNKLAKQRDYYKSIVRAYSKFKDIV